MRLCAGQRVDPVRYPAPDDTGSNGVKTMKHNLAQKIIADHLESGEMTAGSPIDLHIDQTLTQDATGTLVMLELEALGLDRVQTELSVQYVDHNLLQTDNRNPDDHLFLQSACARFGVWFSPPGNGVSHPLHMNYFGKPGKTLLGSDIDVAMAMAGRPFGVTMPEIWGVRLTGELPDWVSAKDVILEMLRRHGVSDGVNRVLEYYGPGLDTLGVMDRHVIANMGTELGATSTVFPSDSAVKAFLGRHRRIDDWRELGPDEGCRYDIEEEIDLSLLEPLIALPSSPGNVVPVREVAGEKIYQSYIGSSANPGFRDTAVVAEMVKGRRVADGVSLDINPTSRDLVSDLIPGGHLAALLEAGARIHQPGCNGCIGMGQAPATGRNSLRTVPRNFPDRSGTPEDSVFLCSSETAAAAALNGVITDPRELEMEYPRPIPPENPTLNVKRFIAPLPADEAKTMELLKGPNIADFPTFAALEDTLELPVLLAVGDDMSTDGIMPAGADVLPYRSNIPEIANFVFRFVDDTYPARALKVRDGGGHVIVAGENYGQGSSREHAAVAPRYLGLRAVLAKSFARIHLQNLINFGVLPLQYEKADDRDLLERGSTVKLAGVKAALAAGKPLRAEVDGHKIRLADTFSGKEREILIAGGIINWQEAASRA